MKRLSGDLSWDHCLRREPRSLLHSYKGFWQNNFLPVYEPVVSQKVCVFQVVLDFSEIFEMFLTEKN